MAEKRHYLRDHLLQNLDFKMVRPNKVHERKHLLNIKFKTVFK